MSIIADLHIHSHYSMAASGKLTPPYLDRWARIKGINLLGTGDCTHPLWRRELRKNLDDAEDGLYVLKPQVRAAFDRGPGEGLPAAEAEAPRFILTGEISTIYKKGGRTRKVHHLVLLAGFQAAGAFAAKLERSGGKIRSDGRPILGLDSADLLALLLEVDERNILIPAHIWTPWFSALGAKSGFDSIGECYEDLVSFIPAVETGLSSNPPMNWAVSGLDRFSIVSSSDAHSPDKLGREATILDSALSYTAIREALRNGVAGTVEFFPQEGKYHCDGHRNCGYYAVPGEANVCGAHICPVCGKPLTGGVMGRVLELADRLVDERAAPSSPGQKPYRSIVPLKEILAEILGVGQSSKKAEAAYHSLIGQAGSELAILMDLGLPALAEFSVPGLPGQSLALAIDRMRRGEVSITPGYDGKYGKIRVTGSG